jgi:hypothetical protein
MLDAGMPLNLLMRQRGQIRSMGTTDVPPPKQTRRANPPPLPAKELTLDDKKRLALARFKSKFGDTDGPVSLKPGMQRKLNGAN